MEFRFQNNSNRDKACALDICVQRKTRCVSEISCGFTFINEIAMPPDHDSSTISEGCSNHLKWRWSVLNQNEGIFDVILPENVLVKLLS